ncbi:MAG: type II secretion system major pseudopilin GspG [Opitutales bacterium]|nr:type II secretion system major pseudopilin GspG [Opitutales bacterium]
MKNRKHGVRRAFTLFEILIVIGLMALLVSFVVGNLDKIMSGAQDSLAKSFVKGGVQTPLMAYKLAVGHYPSTEEGLAALIKAPEGSEENWKGPYIKEIPLDPWKKPYQYAFPGTHNADSFDVWSLGPDGVQSDDDIGNW